MQKSVETVHVSDEIKEYIVEIVQQTRELSQVKVSDYEKRAKKVFIERSTFDASLIAAYLIANAWNKRNLYLKKIKMKEFSILIKQKHPRRGPQHRNTTLLILLMENKY